MSARVYNIIWADDECDTLDENKTIRALFNEKGIEVLAFVPTSERLREKLEIFKDKVDAVIIDGNFSRHDVKELDPEDISGLIHSLSLIELYNIKRDIPFFLYTGKMRMLQQKCKNGELSYFNGIHRIFQKGNLPDLVDCIISNVDHIQSIEWWLSQRYSKLLKRVKNIDVTAAEHLENFLLNEARDIQFDKDEYLFTQLRLMVERIEKRCHDEYIIPHEVSGLNSFSYFWGCKNGFEQKENRRTIKVWKPKKEYMPKLLSESIIDVINILQDGSHEREDLNLHVNEYIVKRKTPFVFRYCLHYVLELMLWFEELLSKLETSADYQIPLYYEDKPPRNNRYQK